MKYNVEQNIEHLGGVYRITNLITGQIYIGSTDCFRKAIIHRHQRTLRSNTHKNKNLQNSFNVYGDEAFMADIVELVPGEAALRLGCEQHYLDQCWDNGVNCFNANRYVDSPRGHKLTDAQRLAMSIRKRGIKASEATKQKMSEARKGIPHWWGYKLGQHNKGKIVSAEMRARISQTLTGRKDSEQVKANKRAARLAYIAKQNGTKPQ